MKEYNKRLFIIGRAIGEYEKEYPYIKVLHQFNPVIKIDRYVFINEENNAKTIMDFDLSYKGLINADIEKIMSDLDNAINEIL